MDAARLRWVVAVTLWCLGATPAVADSTYLLLPGVAGPSTGMRYGGWFEVSQHNLVLLPGFYDASTKAVRSRCTASIRTRLGAAGATVAQLVGGPIGNVRVERVGSRDETIHEAVLRNAVLLEESSWFDGGVAGETLTMSFEAVDLTTYDRRPDGSRASGTQGVFDCLVAR